MAIEKTKTDVAKMPNLDEITNLPDIDVEVERVERNRFTSNEKNGESDDNYVLPMPSKQSATFLREHTFLKRDPARMTCPNCLRGIETIVERRNTSTTHISAFMLLPICLCVLPYCSKMLRDTVHRCPACGINLGAKFASTRDAFIVCFGSQRSNEAPTQDIVVTANSDAQFF